MQNYESIRDAQNMAVQDMQRRIARDHIDYVFGESGTTVTVHEMGTDAVVDALHQLSHAGYTVAESDDDFIPSQLFLTPTLFDDLRDDKATFVRSPRHDPLRAYGAECYADAHLPDGAGLLVHPAATVSTPPTYHERPWDIRDRNGVIVLHVLSRR